ncbi:MAG: hypothetical protein ABIO44_00450 [Saprospiraceae bacterium]
MLVKQSFLLGYLLMGIFLTSCGPTLYLDPGFQSIRKTQKSLAILPFKSSIEGGKLPKGMTKETLIESNMQTGLCGSK